MKQRAARDEDRKHSGLLGGTAFARQKHSYDEKLVSSVQIPQSTVAPMHERRKRVFFFNCKQQQPR